MCLRSRCYDGSVDVESLLPFIDSSSLATLGKSSPMFFLRASQDSWSAPHTVTCRKLLSYLASQVVNWLLPTPISWRRRSCFGQQPSICHRCSFDGYDKKTRLGVYWQAGTSSYLYLGKLTVKLCSRHSRFRAKVLGNRRYLAVRDRALCGRSAIQHLYSLVVIECMESQQGEVLDNIHGSERF